MIDDWEVQHSDEEASKAFHEFMNHGHFKVIRKMKEALKKEREEKE